MEGEKGQKLKEKEQNESNRRLEGEILRTGDFWKSISKNKNK